MIKVRVEFDSQSSRMKTLLSNDAWRKILRLHEHEDIGIKALATRFGVSYNAIREGLAKRKAIQAEKRKTQR
jgi:transposase